jgi:hypothetical protein
MPDQPTASPVPAPGQNLAGHIVSLLVRDPRWAGGPATGRDLETEPFHELLREHLRAAGTDLQERCTDDDEHEVELSLLGVTATITGPTPGIALAAMVLTAWGALDELDELDGGEE